MRTDARQEAKMRGFFVATILILLFQPAMASAPPCRADKAGRALDFWVGTWTVTNAAGTTLGHNRIDRVLSGCALIENWQGVRAHDEGKSLFTFDAARHLWQQVWVTPDTSRPGGLKHKTMTTARDDGAVRFEGEIALPDGTTMRDRTTLTPLPDGRVRQVIARSRDGGATWTTGFDAFYTRGKRKR